MIIDRGWLVDLDGNAPAAAIFQRIAWRCDDTDDRTWVATHAQIAEETGFSLRTVERATKTLRDLGWLTKERASTWDPTPKWTAVMDPAFVIPSGDRQSGGNETTDVAVTQPADVAVTQPADVAVTPSTKTFQTTPQTRRSRAGSMGTSKATGSGGLRKNQYGGNCRECGGHVEAGEGLYEEWRGKGLFWHHGCQPDANRAHLRAVNS